MNLSSGIHSDDRSSEIRPQDDLFRHMNGKWLESTEIPPDRARYGSFVVLDEEAERAVREIIEESQDAPKGSEARKLGDLYSSFLDEVRVESLGYGPIADTLGRIEAISSVEGLLEMVGELEQGGVSGFLSVFIDSDPGDPSRYVVFLEQGGISLPDERYYHEERFEDLRSRYVHHMSAMFALAEREDPNEKAEAVFDLEREISKGHWDNVACRDSNKTYNLMPWESYRALAESKAQNFDVDLWRGSLGAPQGVFDEVVVRQPSYSEHLGSLVTKDRLPQWKHWLTWKVIHGGAPYLSSSFVEENFAFYGTALTGASEMRDRWKRGVSLVGGAMGEAVGRIYVERHFPPESKVKMDDLVSHLLEAYRERISNLDWMTPPTRDRALNKLDKFVAKIGYPTKWRDYSTLVIDRDDLWGNVMRIAEFYHKRELNKIGKPIDREEWFMTPQTINAYYNPGFNEIVFPAAILQFPFFDPSRDDAANYGAIGAVIGHEIGHGFDDEGSKYDGDGRLLDWWTEDDRAAFEERTHVLIDQYSALSPQQTPDQHVNGELTIGENIGDLGGVGIAWVAYQNSLGGAEAEVIEGMSGAHRFFLSWAQAWREKRRDEEMIRLLAIDPHSPAEFRCNQVVKNLDAFHEAFDVHEGDGMWLEPDARVRIW